MVQADDRDLPEKCDVRGGVRRAIRARRCTGEKCRGGRGEEARERSVRVTDAESDHGPSRRESERLKNSEMRDKRAWTKESVHHQEENSR